MTAWLLVLVLHFHIGPAREPAVLQGGKPYPSVHACDTAGRLTAEWLLQDFVTVTYACIPTTTTEGE